MALGRNKEIRKKNRDQMADEIQRTGHVSPINDLMFQIITSNVTVITIIIVDCVGVYPLRDNS